MITHPKTCPTCGRLRDTVAAKPPFVLCSDPFHFPPEQGEGEAVLSGLPPDLARVLRDRTITVPQDQAVFELIESWAKAPSNTASPEINPAPSEQGEARCHGDGKERVYTEPWWYGQVIRERVLGPLKERHASVESMPWDDLLGVAVRNLNLALDLDAKLARETASRERAEQELEQARAELARLQQDG